MRGMRRSERKLSERDTLAVLDEAAYGVLCTVCDDGLPYGVPMNFVRQGQVLYFHCADKGQKLDNLKYHSRACFTAVSSAVVIPEEQTSAYRSAMAFGTLSAVTDPDRRREAMAALLNKYCPGQELPPDIAATPHLCVLQLETEFCSGKSNPRSGKPE